MSRMVPEVDPENLTESHLLEAMTRRTKSSQLVVGQWECFKPKTHTQKQKNVPVVGWLSGPSLGLSTQFSSQGTHLETPIVSPVIGG